MWKGVHRIILNNRSSLLKLPLTKEVFISRKFLSPAYYCDEVWDQRLKSSLLQKVNLDELYYELDQTFLQTKNISAVDVDIFANSVSDDEHLGEVRDLVHKLRLSADCGNTLQSTGHAITRLFLRANKSAELLDILDDRINYGVFLDYFDANILMNTFIKNKEYASAARIAVQLMLQEDFDHELTSSLSALSCYLYLTHPEGWPTEPEPEPESKEEIKVRVKFLRNPFFDDHFDLRDPLLLVGKTLHMIGLRKNDDVHISLRLLGLILHKKSKQASELVKELKGSNQPIYKQVITLLDTRNFECKEDLQSLGTVNGDLQEELEKSVRVSERLCSERDVATQCKLYTEWEEKRNSALEEQKQRLIRMQRLAEVENSQKELQEREQRLWFFDREDQLELESDSKKVYYKKRWFGKKKKPRKIDEGYIPPEIIPKKSN